MKKSFIITAMLLLFAGTAFAGIWGAVKGFMGEQAIEVIIASVVAIVGLFWGGAKLWGKFFKESIDIPLAVKKARDEKSPGGTSITSDEMQNIGKESAEAVAAGLEAYKATRPKDK